MDFFTQALRTAFETKGNSQSFYHNGEQIILHSEMNIDEVFEIFDNEISLDKNGLILLEESIDNLQKQKGLMDSDPLHSETAENLGDELQYEYERFLKNNF